MDEYTTLEQVKIRLKQFHIETVTDEDGVTSDVVVFDQKEDNPYIEQLIKQARNEMWMWFGTYGLSAVSVAVEHCLAGRKAKSKYIKKPINEQQGKDDSEMTEEEIKKQRELFVAKLKVMQSNYELSHPNQKRTWRYKYENWICKT